jgi:hypothetical protein
MRAGPRDRLGCQQGWHAMPPALLALLLLAPATAHAASDPGDPPGPSAPDPPDLSAPPAPTARPPSDLDFELLEPAPGSAPARDPAFERRVARRRTMLKVHQGLGLATWTALAATAVVGQLHFDDRFRGGGDTGRYRTAHRTLAFTTATLFTAAGLLALLAPEPYAKREARLDTATLHKVSMGVATAGLVAQVILGLAARGKAGSTRERDLAATHQVVGYATLGAMTVGTVILFF